MLREVFEAIDQGHVQIWSSTPAVQADIERLGAAGAWPQPSGLAVGIIEQNIAANKIDQMLERSYEIETVGSHGKGDTSNAKVHVSIDFVNHAPADGLPTYVLGPYNGARSGLKAGDNRQMVTLYSSVPWQMVKVNGQPVQVMSYRDGNWWATVVAATVPQGGSALVEMYAEGLVPEGTYRIDVFTGVNVSRGMLDCASAKVQSAPAQRHSSCPF